MHSDPLAASRLVELEPPDWNALFCDPSKPLLLDLGCATGAFTRSLSAAEPSLNCVGVDLREDVIHMARSAAPAALGNLAYLRANVAHGAFVERLLSTYQGALMHVTVHYPNPWPRARDARKRMLQPALVRALAERMAVGGTFVCGSEYASCAEEMRAALAADPGLRLAHGGAEWCEGGSPWAPYRSEWQITIDTANEKRREAAAAKDGDNGAPPGPRPQLYARAVRIEG